VGVEKIEITDWAVCSSQKNGCDRADEGGKDAVQKCTPDTDQPRRLGGGWKGFDTNVS